MVHFIILSVFVCLKMPMIKLKRLILKHTNTVKEEATILKIFFAFSNILFQNQENTGSRLHIILKYSHIHHHILKPLMEKDLNIWSSCKTAEEETNSVRGRNQKIKRSRQAGWILVSAVLLALENLISSLFRSFFVTGVISSAVSPSLYHYHHTILFFKWINY